MVNENSSAQMLRGRVTALEDKLAGLARAQRLLQSARESLDEIARLPDDWDSYGAARPSASAISRAHLLLASLWEDLAESADDDTIPWAIAPLADGGVQLEWRGPHEAIEVEIDSRGSLNYLVERDETTIGRSDPAMGAAAEEVLAQIRRVLGR
jgi:hypothetical protein